MLDRLKTVCYNVQRIDGLRVLKSVLKDKGLQDDITSLNTEDQLYEKGIDSKGKSLGQYSPATIEGTKNFLGKKQKGQRYDHITLSDTGAFYKSFRIKNIGDGFIISADADKGGSTSSRVFNENTQSVQVTSERDSSLVNEYGEDIIGLTDENVQRTRNWIKPLFIEEARKGILSQSLPVNR